MEIDADRTASAAKAYAAGKAAFDAYTDAATTYASYAAFAAKAASDAAYAARADDDTVTKAADAADAAAKAADAAPDATRTDVFLDWIDSFLSILLNDLQAIRNEINFEKKDITGLYGSIWTDFLKTLEEMDCKYWSNLYRELFSKNFVLDETDIQKMKQRTLVPIEIREMGVVEVGKYLAEMETQETETLNEARVIILGEKGAGKTCLARRLKNPRAGMTTDDESTPGIDKTDWIEENCNIHIWDFAGHIVTHAVHRFFLSERCVYIIVYNSRTEEREKLFYWLNYIKNYVGNSTVFILVNVRDIHRIELTLNDAKRDGYNIHDPIYFFSIKDDGEKLLSFRKDLLNFIQNHPSWDSTKIPKEDYQIKQELENLFSKKGTEKKDWITYNDFEGIVKKISQKDDAGIKSILRRLNALGIGLWYENMKENNTLILNPEWVCNGIYSIVNWVNNHKRYAITIDEFSEVFASKQEGGQYLNLFNSDEFSDVFASEQERYPKEKFGFLFELMEIYELAYKDERSEVNRIIIPHLLREDCPSGLPNMNSYETLSIRFTSDDLLPENIISRFIVRNNEEIKRVDEEDMVWRYGVVLENEKGNTGLIEEIKNSITVSVKGPDKTEYITRIWDSLAAIFDTYKAVKPNIEYKLRLYGDNDETSKIRGIWLKDEKVKNYLKNDKPYYDDEANREYNMKELVRGFGIMVNNITVSEGSKIDNLAIGNGNNQSVQNIVFNSAEYHNLNIELQGNLNDLIEVLKENGHQEEAADVEGIAKAVKEKNSLEDKDEIKASGIMNRVKRFLGKANDENSTLNKIVTGIKDGAEIVGEIVKAYNSTAKLLGLS